MVDGGAVFALAAKYVLARTAIYAAPEALAPSPGEASLEAAYDVEFSNDNTTFSRVPSDGDAGFGDAASDGAAAIPFVFTVSSPQSASSVSPEATTHQAGAPIAVHDSNFTPGAAPACSFSPQDAAADDGVSLVAAASRSRVRSSPRRSSRRSTRRRRQCRHLGWISVVTGTLRTCGEAPFQLCNCAIFLSTCVWVKLARRATRNPPIQYLTLVFLRVPRTLQVFTAAQLQVAMFARDLGRSSLAGNFFVSLGVRLVARTMPRFAHAPRLAVGGSYAAWSALGRARVLALLVGAEVARAVVRSLLVCFPRGVGLVSRCRLVVLCGTLRATGGV